MKAHFILYVRNQARSTAFYERALGQTPALNVPGMTEFALSSEAVLGLMPEAGIARLLGPALPDPGRGDRPPRAELYLLVESAAAGHARAVAAGAAELDLVRPRDWGHLVGYSLDPDGHVLAFAQEPESGF